MQIEIKCKGAETVELSRLVPLQGNLKSLSEKNYTKLKNKILKHGFTAPFHIWHSPDGKCYIIDGHQRDRVLSRMCEEGWKIPALPADPIIASTKKEAIDILLSHASSYGVVEKDGLYEFMNANELNIDSLEDLELSGIDVVTFKDEFFANPDEVEVPEVPVGEKTTYRQMSFQLTEEQSQIVAEAVKKSKALGAFGDTSNENSSGNALERICETFVRVG